MRTTRTIIRDGDDRSRFIARSIRAGSVTMKSMKAKVAVMAITAAVAGGVMAAPAFGAAGPNDGGTNCHGVWLSYLSTSDMAPDSFRRISGSPCRMFRRLPLPSVDRRTKRRTTACQRRLKTEL